MTSAKKSPRYNWRPFQEARAFVRGLSVQGEKQYRIWAKSAERPHDIPAHPDRVYQTNGWKSWGDWFGTQNNKQQVQN
jgi:hypothetical protein